MNVYSLIRKRGHFVATYNTTSESIYWNGQLNNEYCIINSVKMPIGNNEYCHHPSERGSHTSSFTMQGAAPLGGRGQVGNCPL